MLNDEEPMTNETLRRLADRAEFMIAYAAVPVESTASSGT